MAFKRRDPPPFLERARDLVYPRKGWRRAIAYLGHRIRRIPDTPHRIALGFACGAFVSFSPLFGLHFLYGLGLAWILRGNLLASLLGTFVGNPLTFPIIAPLALALGRRILGQGGKGGDFQAISRAVAEAAAAIRDGALALLGRGAPDWGRLDAVLDDLILPYFVGGIAPGLAAALASYLALRPLVAAYQAARRARVTELARRRATEIAARHRAEAGAKTGAETGAKTGAKTGSDTGADAGRAYTRPPATQGEAP